MRRSERKSIDPDLGILAGQLLFSVQREVFESLDDQGHRKLRPRHGAVLAYLDVEGSRATELAQRSGQHKQVIGTLIDELEELGYVERKPDPNDRRAKLIVPTERGLEQMVQSDAAFAAIEQRMAQALGEQAYRDFRRAFQQVVKLQRENRPEPSAQH